ncbi:MAG: hypothetical protein ABW133_16170 [Polyangiaceae bacterium]
MNSDLRSPSFRAFASGGAVIAALLASMGCDKSDRDRIQAGQVLRALEVVRAAPNENKRRPADELATTPCSSPIVCGARDSCAEAYQHLARGTDSALRVKNELDRIEKIADTDAGRERMTELAAELDHADREIGGARESLKRCEEAASLMRRTFGI